MLTKDIGSLALPFMSSLTPVSNKATVTPTILARTSAKSWEEKRPFPVNPMERKVRPAEAASGPFNGVISATWKFSSFFAGKAGEASGDFIKDPSRVIAESPDTRILVVGSGYLPLDELADQEDLIFFFNAVDWLVQDPEMINIRNRGLSDRPIAELRPAAKNVLRYTNVIGVPLVFVLFGFGRWRWLKARLRNFRL
jgi:ABC-type uncharacterized transport system involved in gliding motility auxiliary subunit